MKEKNKKDERLEALFSEYAQDEKMPPATVTQAAKEYINKQRVTEKATVPVTVTAGGNGSDGSGNASHNNKTLYIVAVCILLILATLICYFATRKPVLPNVTAGLTSVSTEQLAEKELNYSDKEFLPFVNSSKVNEYKEYALTDAIDGHAQGEVVVYYVSFDSSEDIAVSMYVEIGGIYLSELDEYKQITTEKELGGITFYFSKEKDCSRCYFGYNNFGYNVLIDTTDKSIANGILTFISESLKN